MTVTEEIKQRLDIVELIGSNGVQLRKAGRNFTGFCPFHPNARTPAFYVFPDTQSYYCFSCHKSGDAFTFVMERQGLEFGDALKELAARAAVQLPERSPVLRDAQEQENALQAKLRQINEDAAVYWNHLLRNTARGEPGRAYIEQRDLNETSVESWQLGYAPDDWTDLLRHLTDRKGHTAEEIEQAGLVIKRESGGFYDRFRNRLMFPIRDLKGAIVGFGGRTLGDDHAKYMNTPETPIFHKSSLLFGLHQAREGIRRENRAVVVEGYLDVITAHQAGFDDVVAPMGTALTAEQVKTLRKLTGGEGRLYLALDADEAGRRAAEKGLNEILQSSERKLVQLGPYEQEWEVDLSLPVRIIELNDGNDPDDVIKSNPDLWRELIAKALPIIDFLFDLQLRGLMLQDPEQKKKALANLAPFVAQIRDFDTQAIYLQKLADILQMKFEFLRERIISITKQKRQQNFRSHEIPQLQPDTPLHVMDPYAHEDQMLSLLLRFPQIRERVEDTLSGELKAFPALSEDVPSDLRGTLARTENRLIWYAWSEHGPDGPADVAAWARTLDPTLRSHAERLLSWVDDPPLSKLSARADARDRANGIAQILRQATAKRRQAEMKSMLDYVDDPIDHAQLVSKLDLVLKYTGVVKAPQKSTIFPDLGSRREEGGF